MPLFPDNTQAVADLQNRLKGQFQYSVTDALCQIVTPFHYPSGQNIQILVSPNPDNAKPYQVDDLGAAAAELKVRLGYNPEQPFDGHVNHLFNTICNRCDVIMDATGSEMETVRGYADHEALPAVICKVLEAALLAAYIDE